MSEWMLAYRKAWESNDPADIRVLCTDDAAYYKEPFAAPARGLEAIIAMWLEHRDAAGSTTFTWKPLSITETEAIVQGETRYSTVTYSNLWSSALHPTAA